ncbi:hypothetical protein D3C84_1056880 [compost metagenome]
MIASTLGCAVATLARNGSSNEAMAWRRLLLPSAVMGQVVAMALSLVCIVANDKSSLVSATDNALAI